MALLTETAKQNLCQLATYLQSLPPDYKHFNMHTWFEGRAERTYAKGQKQVYECGTSACLAGHGPAAGIPRFNRDWSSYARRTLLDYNVFASYSDRERLDKVFNFLFTSHWEDDHYDGAARIRAVLEHDGVPVGRAWKKYRIDHQVPLEREPVPA